MNMHTVSSILISLLFSTVYSGFSTMNAQDADPTQITVMSYNIRYNTENDGINAWPYRKDHVADIIGSKYKSDIVGLQEVLKGQIDDLQERLPDYAWVGQGRDDGKEAGEFSPIFYDNSKYEVMEDHTFWLSETPEVPGSISWDAAITRVVTSALLKDKDTGREFYFLNTHFDHRGDQARIESAKVIVEYISTLPEDIPIIVTGDFNVPETSEAYSVIMGAPNFLDARYASETEHEGPTATTNNWEEMRPPETRIDYIFIREGVRVLNHRILDDRYDERFPSDHLPVIADVELR